MEPVFMVLGQSAAVAASMAIDAGCTVQEIDVNKLRNKLKQDPYLDGTLPELLVDDTDIDKVKRKGAWTKRIGANYKTSFVSSPNVSGKSLYSFYPRIRKQGKYAVYFYCTGLSENELPKSLYLDIQHAQGINTVSIDPRKQRGGWASLGKYEFGKDATITINGEKTEGPLFADAVLLIPAD